MKKRQFIHILRKYREGRASRQEKDLIDSYYDLFEMEPEGEDWPDALRKGEIKEQALGEIWERIRGTKDVVAMGKKRTFSPAVWKIAAVALLLISMGFLAYLESGERHAPGKDLVRNTVEGRSYRIHPGGHHAILTLAGGTQLILDSARNGSLARQGSTRIIKLGNGQLIYKGSVLKTPSAKVLYNTITTPSGGEYQVTLPDGSKVWLNAGSSLRFPTAFLEATRSVEVSGEAYFEIEQMAEKPFVVRTGGVKIEVLGTHFNVNTYYDEGHLKTTLTEGSIKISNGSFSRLLKPGQKADMDRETGVIEVAEANVDQVLAWKNGLFYFDNTNIRTIMREISRWYNVEVVYEGSKVYQNTFSGVVSRYSNVEDLLKRLELTGTVHFTIKGNQIMVSR